MIPNLYSQFRPLSCTSDSHATLYYLHLTFPKMNWLCPSLKPAPPKAIPSQVMVPPFIQLLKTRTLGSLSTILFLWVLIQCIRKFFKMYPTAAPHFTQGKFLQWPDYLLLPLSASLLSLLSHPIPSRQALLFLEPSMHVSTSGLLHRTPTPNIFIVHFFTHFKSLLKCQLLSEASLNLLFKLYSPFSVPAEFYP